MADRDLLQERHAFSQGRLVELADRLAKLPQVRALPELCVYATGSYGRLEASQHSDIDLFFLCAAAEKKASISRLDELRLFAGVIDTGQGLAFPTFSNDAEFLRILYLDQILELLGGREDDYRNHFTARMLLLLESFPLINTDLYEQAARTIIEAYFRDYPDHTADFKPVFLINDVLRFWKTLCLNYEHRRNKPEESPDVKRKQQVKNFKLKFSRLLTCFGTIVGICRLSSPIEPESIRELTRANPLHRLLTATEGVSNLAGVRRAILEDYRWFMELTGRSTDDLHAEFESKENRVELFRRAEIFGQRVYDVLAFFAARNNYSRYLVI
jgi:hypothetical protein